MGNVYAFMCSYMGWLSLLECRVYGLTDSKNTDTRFIQLDVGQSNIDLVQRNKMKEEINYQIMI